MLINATACYLTSEGKTLFVYRNKADDQFKGWYFPPGGRTERGERGVDCVVREFREESGLELVNPKLKVIATFYNQGRNLKDKKDQDDWRVEIYKANQFTGVLRKEHKNSKLIWVDNTDISNLRVYPADRGIMKLLDKKGIFEVLAQYSGDKLVRFKYQSV